MMETLVWRLAAADPRGVPRKGTRAQSVTIGATTELESGGRVWFRVRDDGSGDRLSREAVVAEVRDSGRARMRCEQVTGMYTSQGWVVVDPPRTLDAPEPPVTPDEILLGFPLQTWAEAVTAHLRRLP
jgi:hypothetical protein